MKELKMASVTSNFEIIDSNRISIFLTFSRLNFILSPQYKSK